jgi:hypothetical protein
MIFHFDFEKLGVQNRFIGSIESLDGVGMGVRIEGLRA